MSCSKVVKPRLIVPLLRPELFSLSVLLRVTCIPSLCRSCPDAREQLFAEGGVVMTATRDQVAGTVRPCPWRSKMIRRRELVFAAAHGLGRKQLPALVEIILLHILIWGISVVPFCDQFASRAVLEPRRHAAHDLLHPTTVPVVNVLARRSAIQCGRDDSVFGVVSIALSWFDDKVSNVVI